MELLPFLLLLSDSVFSVFPYFSSSFSINNDTATLLQFLHECDPHGSLLSNWSSSNACTSKWFGVKFSSNGIYSFLSFSSFSQSLRTCFFTLFSLSLSSRSTSYSKSYQQLFKFCLKLALYSCFFGLMFLTIIFEALCLRN